MQKPQRQSLRQPEQKPQWVFIHYGDDGEILYNEDDVYLTRKEAENALAEFTWATKYFNLHTGDVAVIKCVNGLEGLETAWGQPIKLFKGTIEFKQNRLLHYEL